MADGESDGLGFDVGKRAHMTAFVEQCQGGLVAEAAHALVEEMAFHRIVVDDQTAFAHVATPRPNVCRIGALSPIRLNAALKVPRWPPPLRASYCSRFRASRGDRCDDFSNARLTRGDR